jgi:hypothetical protein
MGSMTESTKESAGADGLWGLRLGVEGEDAIGAESSEGRRWAMGKRYQDKGGTWPPRTTSWAKHKSTQALALSGKLRSR